MDSLTQIVLGAAVGEVLLGKKLGWKASFLGAIAGTIPDLDILVNLCTSDELVKLLAHRSYTHSWFMQLFLALPLAYISTKIDQVNYSFKRYFWFWYLGFVTHSLLDAFTAYGTRLFLPFSNELVAFNIVSVVDFIYTIPFLFLLIIGLFFKKNNPKRIKTVLIALVLSTAYLAINGVIKYNLHQKFKEELVNQKINYQEVSTNPTLLNGFLWNAAIQAKDTIYCGEYSIFQKTNEIEFVPFVQNKQLEKGFEGKILTTLKWFANDFYILEKEGNDTLNFYILKWGRMDYKKTTPNECFRFYFKIIKQENTLKLISIQPKPKSKEINTILNDLWIRIFNY
ncbi:MAG: metal-dependent hydrolase [Flavobacterium sp.]